MKSLLTASLLFAFGAFAQNEPISDMYWNNYSFSNPAMSGVKYKHEANVSFRNQFNSNSFHGSPKTWFVNYGTSIKNKHGLGLNYVNESIGFSEANRIKLNYNYQFQLKEDRKLVIGAAAGFYRIGLAAEWKCLGCKPVFLPQNAIQLDLGAAYFGKNITAGVAVAQLPIYKNHESFENRVHLTGNIRYKGRLFSLSSFIIETRLHSDFNRYHQDFNLGLGIQEFLEVGIGYRTGDLVLMNVTGIIAKKYRIGYSYAHTLNGLNSFSNGIHEMTVGLRLPN